MKKTLKSVLLTLSLSICACGSDNTPYDGATTSNDALPAPSEMMSNNQESEFAGVLIISEIMSSNDTAQMDEAGEFDDWIELYNDGETALNLAGWRIADENDYPSAFQFSDEVVIDAKGYLIVWADNDTEQGPLHASFKLSGDGEEIWLYDPEGFVVQHLIFGAIETDTTYGQQSDGDYAELDNPTPGAPNQ